MTLTTTDLRIVNHQVNALPYTTDIEKYKTVEFWEAAEKDGDCEDTVLAKIQLLKRMGLPISQMRIVTCFVQPYRTHEEKAERGHAVLAVDLDGETWFLDNAGELPIPADLFQHEVHKIQVAGTRRFDWAEGADKSFS
jgi:predicted transglutaminase-like cysteine proteinase